MTRTDAEQFARAWIEAWNSRDLEAVLAMYANALLFTSPTALQVVGRSTVAGKAELRAYWQQALGRVESLNFSLDRIVWDSDTRELGIVYTSVTNGQSKRVMELFQFGADDLVHATEVLHGRIPDETSSPSAAASRPPRAGSPVA